jgi:hypothetical protein
VSLWNWASRRTLYPYSDDMSKYGTAYSHTGDILLQLKRGSVRK